MTISTSPAIPADKPITVASSISWALLLPGAGVVLGNGHLSAGNHKQALNLYGRTGERNNNNKGASIHVCL